MDSLKIKLRKLEKGNKKVQNLITDIYGLCFSKGISHIMKQEFTEKNELDKKLSELGELVGETDLELLRGAVFSLSNTDVRSSL